MGSDMDGVVKWPCPGACSLEKTDVNVSWPTTGEVHSMP